MDAHRQASPADTAGDSRQVTGVGQRPAGRHRRLALPVAGTTAVATAAAVTAEQAAAKGAAWAAARAAMRAATRVATRAACAWFRLGRGLSHAPGVCVGRGLSHAPGGYRWSVGGVGGGEGSDDGDDEGGDEGGDESGVVQTPDWGAWLEPRPRGVGV